MRWPWGIAIHNYNVYVTDIEQHVVLHFKAVNGIHLMAKVGGKGSGIGQFNQPKQLAVSANGDVFVPDSYNHRVQVLDNDLHYQRHISHHSMRQPRDVKLTPEEVYVLSSSSPCVHILLKGK